MNRREQIRLTLNRIKVTKSLVARLAEFVRLARKAGHEPVHSIQTLEKFETELAELRADLARLTLKGQEEFVTRQAASPPSRQRAA